MQTGMHQGTTGLDCVFTIIITVFLEATTVIQLCSNTALSGNCSVHNDPWKQLQSQNMQYSNTTEIHCNQYC